MGFVVNDRVKQVSTSIGTGTFQLGSVPNGYQGFIAGIGDTNTTYYAAFDGASAWEVGVGVVSAGSPATLSRAAVLASSNGGFPVNFAITPTLWCDLPASKAVFLDEAGGFTFPGDLHVGGDVIVSNGQGLFILGPSGTTISLTGVVATYNLDQAGGADIAVRNNDASVIASASFLASNGAQAVSFGIYGSGFTTDGVKIASRGFINAPLGLSITSGTDFRFAGNGSTTACFTIAANGDVKNTNNSYGAISDVRLKTNVTSAASQWGDVLTLAAMVSNFTMIADKEGHKQIGLIAQDVQRVSPGLVVQDEDGMLSVRYSVLHIKALKALGEAMQRIEELETAVRKLASNAQYR